MLSYLLPNVNWLMLASENVLETTMSLKEWNKLRRLDIQVLASDDYEGMINDDHSEAEYIFELKMTDKQLNLLQSFCVYLDEFDQ